MFLKGLIHKVNIYPLEKNTSNRTQLAEMKNLTEPIENVMCRLIKDEKAMFKSEISLREGDVIEDLDTSIKYTVQSDNYKAVGFNLHHRTYVIKRKVI